MTTAFQTKDSNFDAIDCARLHNPRDMCKWFSSSVCIYERVRPSVEFCMPYVYSTPVRPKQPEFGIINTIRDNGSTLIYVNMTFLHQQTTLIPSSFKDSTMCSAVGYFADLGIWYEYSRSA
jgi:hypothetical protein